MKLAIIVGSHRKQSMSRAAADWVRANADEQNFESEIFDVADLGLEFWHEDLWNSESEMSKRWKPISSRLRECDATVVIAPEWSGMVPPALTNFFLHCSAQEFSYKPALLIAVSTGPSGTYPIAQLRMSAAKNNQMIFLPDHLILRHAGGFLKPAEGAAGSADPSHALNRRLHYNLGVMLLMAKALGEVRNSIDTKLYPYGL